MGFTCILWSLFRKIKFWIVFGRKEIGKKDKILDIFVEKKLERKDKILDCFGRKEMHLKFFRF